MSHTKRYAAIEGDIEMGEYFKDKEQMCECFGALFEKMRFDERTGGRAAAPISRRTTTGFSRPAHTDEDLQRTWDIFDDALKAV